MTVRRHQKAVLAAVAVSGLLVTAACGASEDDAAGTPTATGSQADGASSDGAPAGEPGDASYAAGTYEAEGSYTNPGGISTVGVEITLADGGTVEDVTVTPQASGTSEQFQEKFAGGIAEEIVGRRIDELDVSKVAGSSLTSGGFNEALEQIKADASA